MVRGQADPPLDKEMDQIDWAGKAIPDERQADEMHNQGIRHLRAALEFYTLEAHPIMHINLTLEVSETLRLTFEALILLH